MSRPPSVSENSLPDTLVTPAASAQHDCSARPELSSGKQRRHNARDQQLMHQDVQQAPSPSRAESPTAHQWSKPASSFTLKRALTLPVERLSRPDRSYSPQLSERDSIFATHYLPSDNDISNTPQLAPAQDVDNGLTSDSTPGLDNAPTFPFSSSKIPFRRPSVDRSHMEVDVRRNHPLRSSTYVSPPLPVHPSTLRPIASDVAWDANHNEPDRRLNAPVRETFHLPGKASSDGIGTKHTPLEEPFPNLSLISASLRDSSSQSRHPEYSEQTRDRNCETRVSRSSSRTRRGRVENSIEANLTNAEPTSHVRSRKSSHYLGLFKENTTSPDRKRREDRDGKHEEPLTQDEPSDVTVCSEPEQIRDSFHAHAGDLLAEGAGPRTSKSSPQLLLSAAPSIEPTARQENRQHILSDDVSKRQPKSLPRSLLEEIRSFHLTPGGGRGSSFSKSIPTQYAEGGRDYFSEIVPDDGLSPPDTIGEQRRGSAQFDDEEEEQISSAVYFPHERVTVSEEVDQVESFPEHEPDVERFDESAPKSSLAAVPIVQESSHVDISLRSKNDSRILHGELQDLHAPTLEEYDHKPLPAISERSGEYSTCESEFASADDSSVSAREEESSLTDDADVTPTATPTQRSRFPRPRRKHTSTRPVGAVELKPYRHQVGGHTTVFRFSRRAVCKQLNNRENEFYERIERRHPEMLMFLPRYIGVLNVTFSKNSKRRKASSENNAEPTDTEHSKDLTHDENDRKRSISKPSQTGDAEPERIFSQKQVTGIIPKVILENNRHIIPADLFMRCQRPRAADSAASGSERSLNGNHAAGETQSVGGSTTGNTSGPTLEKPIARWGATTVNRKLQEQVLREVFSPPTIHHHRRHARGHLNLPRTSSDSGRRRANQSEDQSASLRHYASESVEAAPSSSGIDISKPSKEGPVLSSSASTALDADRLQKARTEEPQPRASSLSGARRVRRRHSGSGLQRRGSISSSRAVGQLMFFEDDGYGGDKEDGIFSMEGDNSLPSPSHSLVNGSATAPIDKDDMSKDVRSAPLALRHSPPKSSVRQDSQMIVPSNPKEAQTRKDERVQFFLLLEDLTAGMNKPCVLDLKMGTRQYGIEANEKKRKSQRRKCQSTTSQQLGVRLCGMQTWNVRKQEYTFEDKYFGRDLKSGREFQDALTRFLYDGVSYRSVAKKIPIILDKLAKLENMIRRLKRYRLYASSLLILYDGEQNSIENSQVDDTHNADKRAPLHRRPSEDGHNNTEVHLKIVDFANCVTGEDELPPDVPCPPQHPDDIDRGYLRGLRSLRMYFQRILKEVTQDEFVERGESEAIALRSRRSDREESSDRFWDESVLEEDPGEVSF
ncbi:hypothetical protein CDV55_106952 [Aspergillus turcosus]|uniref:Kinase n=1 Tax=Aspergillus turcosus TaxID=1245748 RepID=A0A229XDS9_9EURO|nr:hypothetical protein CDV55_106952 [Aspergillus turcosus]RLL97800.1 hypothetical protein CFD26_101002 [Aspergillus turcosus]